MSEATQSKSLWQSWSGVTKFSILAFAGAEVLSLLSLGALGYLVYYAVAPLLPESIEQLAGDSVWPSVIMAGMCWSIGFLIAGLLMHYLKNVNLAGGIKYFIYAVVLWVWDYIIWFVIIHFSVVN